MKYITPGLGLLYRRKLIRLGIIKPAPRFFKIIYKNDKPHTLVVRLDGKEVV